jgi:two-component system chemotaxis response regulator CheB
VNRGGPIRVLIINDLPLLRQALAAALEEHADLHVHGCSGRVEDVRRALLQMHPEVILFDLDLPRSAALELLKKLRTHYPVPVIVCAAGGPDRSMRAIRAIQHGATDVVTRPDTTRGPQFATYARELATKVRLFAGHVRPVAPLQSGRPGAPGFRAAGLDPQAYLAVLGASTGGTQAISALVEAAPGDFPPLVIVQHMPPGFTASFARRLNGLGALRVTEAADGDMLSAGRAVVARGDRHLVVRAAGGSWRVHYTDDPPVNRHCPSVDVLFESTLPYARRTIAILLTGMGADGAAGMTALHHAGALTVAQDEASCVVYGMPKEALRRGGVTCVASPPDIPAAVVRTLAAGSVASASAR